MTAIFQRQTARAMSEQLTRVNALENTLVERLRAEIADLQAQLTVLREQQRVHESQDGDGRQWLTPAEFARTISGKSKDGGISQSTISRALTHKSSNVIVGKVQYLPGGRYLIERSATLVRGRKSRQ